MSQGAALSLLHSLSIALLSLLLLLLLVILRRGIVSLFSATAEQENAGDESA